MKKRKSLLFVSTVVLMIAVLSFSALASSDSAADQMAANSAAWWIAYNAGDTATCNALHDANTALANQAAGTSGSASFNSDSGSWTVTNSSGTMTSTGSEDGKINTVTYGTTSNSGSYSSTSSSSYTDSSISAYMASGGTTSGLQNSYNNAAAVVSVSGNYGDKAATTSAENEAAVAKAVLGLSDNQTAQLQARLENAKHDFDIAQIMYNDAVANGDTAKAEAAQAAMKAAHDNAQVVRASYNYSGDSSEVGDGGYFYGNGSSGGNPGDGYFTVDITPTYTITASAGAGGSISPSGSQSVTKGGSLTITIIPNSEYRVSAVQVDGSSVGVIGSYTFSNVTSSHTISASFTPSGHVSISSTSLYDYKGNSLSGGTIKSGYSVLTNVITSSGDVHNVAVTAQYNFGSGMKSITLTETSTGIFQFPVNPESTQHYRCVYIPVATSDGTYTITYTITATDAAGNTLSDTRTDSITVKGNMYEDDATGDS